MSRVVIVGAGLAGLRGAQELRRREYSGEIVIVGDETHRPYNRPPLSKELLGGDLSGGSLSFDTSGLEVRWHLGRAATALDVGQRTVVLDDGSVLSYDRLMIATGVRPRPWPGAAGLAGVHQLRTIEDARALRQEALSARHAVIIGAGFIGCEIAAALRALGVGVTLIDVASQPLAVLGPALGERARSWHEAAGVRLLLAAHVEAFLSDDGIVRGVRLTDGRVVDGDLVVVGIGAVPNTEWLVGSGLTLVNGAVSCDRRCLAVGAPDVGVAGDVAAWPHPDHGAPTRVEHWTNAVETAMTAAANLFPDAGGEVLHRSVPTFWSDQYDHKLRGVGAVSAAHRATIVADDPATGRFVVEFHDDDVLTGAVTVNGHREHLAYRRRLSQDGVPHPMPGERRTARSLPTHQETA